MSPKQAQGPCLSIITHFPKPYMLVGFGHFWSSMRAIFACLVACAVAGLDAAAVPVTQLDLAAMSAAAKPKKGGAKAAVQAAKQATAKEAAATLAMAEKSAAAKLAAIQSVLTCPSAFL